MAFTREFDRAFRHVIGEEGGYVNDPRDPGGETKYGIAKRYHPGVDIPNLTLDRAKDIYWRDYWVPAGCDDLPWAAGYLMFDAAVNMGLRTSVRLMQTALGVTADGIVGPVTRGGMQRLGADPELVVRFQAERMVYYASRDHWDRFGRGWSRRVIRGAITATAGVPA